MLALIASLFALPALPASAEVTPSVNLTMNKSVYLSGQTATFTSHMEAMNLTWVVDIQYPNSTAWKQLCFAINVNVETHSCKLGLAYNMKVRARLIDQHGTPDDPNDDTVEATAPILNVPVRARLGTIPQGYYTKVRGYAVMSKYSAKFRSVSAPAFPGKRCLRHQVQRKYASGWRLVKTSACILEGKQGRVDWQWGGSHPSKVNFRIRATFAGDAVNRANNGAWLYFRFR